MRKFLTFCVAALCMCAIVGCSSCNKKDKDVKPDSVSTELVVENTVSTDREYMFTNYGEEYRWYETCVLLKEYLDEECTGSIAGISNVFQAVLEVEKGFDTKVVLFTYTPDTCAIEVKDAFWVEDFPMNDDAVKVTFKEAFDKVMAVNYPKPHSKHVVLRKQIGPKACNPQWIFGNQHAQLYVDAVTGDVTDKNPAFGDIQLETPLGEWP